MCIRHSIFLPFRDFDPNDLPGLQSPPIARPSYPLSDRLNYSVPTAYVVCGNARDWTWPPVGRSGANNPRLSPTTIVHLVVLRHWERTDPSPSPSFGWVTRVYGMFFAAHEALEVASLLYMDRSLEAHPHGSSMVHNSTHSVGIIRAPLWQMQLEGILIGGQSGALLIRLQELRPTHPISPGN